MKRFDDHRQWWILLLLIASTVPASSQVNSSFRSPDAHHVSYNIGRSHATTFSMKLEVNGPGVSEVLQAGTTILTGKYRLETDSAGNYNFTLTEIYTQSGSNVTEVSVLTTLQKATNVAGTLLFNDALALGSGRFFTADGVTIPPTYSLTINDTMDTGSALNALVGGTLELNGCQFHGLNVANYGSGERAAYFANTRFEGDVLVNQLAEVSFTTCLFPSNTQVNASDVTVDDCLFVYIRNAFDGFCSLGGPIFTPGATYDIGQSEFRSGDIQLYSGTAVGSFHDNALVNCFLAVRGNGATLPTVNGNSFYSSSVIVEDSSVTSMALDGNYWGGRFRYDGAPFGWLTDFGGGSTLGSSNTSYLSSGNDRICSITDDRPLPYCFPDIHCGNISVDRYDLVAPRSNRECLVVCDVHFPGEELTGASFELRCGGQTFTPVNSGFAPRANYRDDLNSATRTLNFILPASFAPSTNVLELWMDATTASGWANNPGWCSKTYRLNSICFSQTAGPARPLRIGVVAASIKVAGYIENTDRGNRSKGRASSLDNMITRLKNDIATHWPLNDNEIEILNLGIYDYEGGWISSWAAQVSSIGMMYSLAMELNTFLDTYNESHTADPLDAIVCVVPGTSLGAANEGASLRGLRRVALVDEGSPGAALHELGHAFGLYTGTEQYNLNPGLDAGGNIIVKDRGAVMQAVTIFNSSPSHEAAALNGERIRHFAYGSTEEVYDFMGAKEPHWIVPSSLQAIHTALYGQLGVKSSGLMAKQALHKDKSGGWPLLVRGLYRIYWHTGRGEWDTEMATNSISLASGALSDLQPTSNSGAELNTRIDGLNAAGVVVTSIFSHAIDFGQTIGVWYPWQEVYWMPESVVLCKVWHIDLYGNNLELRAMRTGAGNLTNSLNASVVNTSTGQNVVVSWTSSSANDPLIRFDRSLEFSTNGTDWANTHVTYLTNRVEVPAEYFGCPSQLWFRLTLSDGFGASASQTAPVTLQGQPPLVNILYPWNGDTAPTGTAWRLSAAVNDLFDGNFTNVLWTSSLQGALGSGRQLANIILTQGTHVVRCTAVNRLGLSSTGMVTLAVQSRVSTNYDLSVSSNALTCLAAGGDPAGDLYLRRLSPGITNVLTVTLRNQGMAQMAQARVSITEAGRPEQVLLNTTRAWAAFEERVWAWTFTPTSRVAHTVRAELNAIGFPDTNTANNAYTWSLTNLPPVARSARLEIRQDELPLTNRLWAYDPNGDPLQLAVVSQPPSGTVILNGSNFVWGVDTNWQGMATFQFNASDGLATSTPATVTIVVYPRRKAPVITSALTANGTQGIPFTYQITATNDPVQFTASSVPSGLGLANASGMITGTPAITGTRYITIGALNMAGSTSTTLSVYFAPGWPAITSSLSAAQFVNLPFSYQIQATHNPSGFSAIGLPAGIGLQRESGWITGVCSVAGTYTVTLGATNFYGAGTAYLGLTICNLSSSNDYFDLRRTLTGTNIVVNGSTENATRENGEPVHAGGASPAGSLWWSWTAPRSGFVTISATSQVFDILLAVYTGNALNGLTCVASNNNWRWDSNSLLFFQAVSGTVYQIALDSDYTRGAFGLRLEYRGAPLITNSMTFQGVAGQPFRAQIYAINNPTSYNAVGLPGGLHVATVTGVITGVPSGKTAQYVYFYAANASGTDTSMVWFTIMSAEFPVFTNACHAAAIAGSNFAFRLTATHALAGTYAAWPLPYDLSLNVNNGWITGTPYIAGLYAVPISVQNSQYEMSTNMLWLNVRLPYTDWLVYHFTSAEMTNSSISGPDADADEDGLSNRAEHYCGTDPRDIDSGLMIECVGAFGQTRVIGWQSVDGYYYQIGAASNVPGPYVIFTNAIRATPPLNCVTDAIPRGDRTLYRILLEP